MIDSPRMIRETFTAANGLSFPQIGFVKDSYNMANGAVGLKFNPAGKLLIDLNVLFKLDSSGLRDKLTPLVGIPNTHSRGGTGGGRSPPKSSVQRTPAPGPFLRSVSLVRFSGPLSVVLPSSGPFPASFSA